MKKVPSPTLSFVWFLVIQFFFPVKITDMVCRNCLGLIFISLNNEFEDELVTDSDSAQFFKEGSIPQLFFSSMKNERMPSEEAKIETLSTCNSSIFHPKQDLIGGKVADIYQLSIEQMSGDF